MSVLATKNTKFYIGVDPGSSGAVAVIDCGGKVLLLADLPANEEGFPNGGALLEMLAPYRGACACLERPTAFTPNAYAMMALGCSFGACLAVLQCLAPGELITPTPRSWKAKGAMNLSADKEVSKTMARQLFSDMPKRLRHDKAEAVLLAEYCRRKCEKKVSG